jgi:hypothetical protein
MSLDVGITDGRFRQQGQRTLEGLNFGPTQGLVVGHRGADSTIFRLLFAITFAFTKILDFGSV